MNGNVYTRARQALMKAGQNAYIGRKQKKREFRALWMIRINNAVRKEWMNYSTFVHACYLKRVTLNRKVLSNIAISHPSIFSKIVDAVK